MRGLPPVSVVTKETLEPIEHAGVFYVPISIDAVRLDSVPLFDLYFQPGPAQPFVLYCERNTVFSDETRKRLEASRIRTVYVRQEQRKDYSRYLSGYLRDILADPDLSVKKKATILYDSAQAAVEEILQQPDSRESVEKGKDIVENTVSFMTRDDFLLEHLLRTISCDDYLYTHSVNVVAYSIALAMRAGIEDAASLRELANGALLHDAGMSKLPHEILNKRSALTAMEWERMKKVPRDGYEMLKRTGALGEIALDIVLHHHERVDGSGYPDGVTNSAISRFVRIVAIADVFDALTSDRYHQKAKSSFEALQIMNKEMRGQLDDHLFKLFVEIMGNRV